jgi:hypothetical protein
MDEKELASIEPGTDFAQWLKKKATTLMITKKAHRVLVVNEEGHLINLITQNSFATDCLIFFRTFLVVEWWRVGW